LQLFVEILLEIFGVHLENCRILSYLVHKAVEVNCGGLFIISPIAIA